jgi:cysteine-rich repeat protein
VVNGTGGDAETCDDGNTTTETVCPYGPGTCTACDATCDTSLNLTGPRCGDNVTNGPEVCDDGNTTTESACAYGSPTCNICNGGCSALIPRTGEYCGDGVTNGTGGDAETCDDGNTSTETVCPYGSATCNRCDATCDTSLALTGPFCGDGVVNGAETCDDNNAFSCGTCNATCTNTQTPLEASGSIRTVTEAEFNEGEQVTLDDGINAPVLFTIKKSGGFDAGTRVPVDLTVCSNCNTSEVANAFVAAINGVDAGSLLITATFNSNHPKVRLRHDSVSSIGNRPILEDVSDNDFVVSGMAGGGGFDCDAGVGCLVNADCRSGICVLPADGGALGTCALSDGGLP